MTLFNVTISYFKMSDFFFSLYVVIVFFCTPTNLMLESPLATFASVALLSPSRVQIMFCAV